MIQEEILTILLADSVVSGILGARIYPLRLPQKEVLPAAVYQRINVSPVNTLEGDRLFDNTRIQITSWAKTYEAAVNLADAIRQALILSGSLTITTLSEIDIEDRETKSYGVINDYSIWAERALIVPPVLSYLDLETGDFFLLQTSDKLALEV